MAAWDLFHEHGIAGASVDDILKASDTGKSQFYHYFGSKEGLVHAMLEEARRMIKDGEIEGIQPIESWDGLRQWFEGFIEKMAYYEFCRACPLGRFAAELSRDDEEIRKSILLVFEAKRQYTKDFFLTLKAKGELKDEADPDSMAEFCDAILQGASLLSKMHRDEEVVRRTLDHAYAYMESFKRDDKKPSKRWALKK